MQRFFSASKNTTMRSLALSVVFSTLFIAVSVGAATTISTNITTDGNMTVTGTASVTGLTTMVYASSTGQSLSGNIQVAGNILANGYATTTGSSGNIATAGTLTVVGTSSFTGLTTMVYASSTTQSLSGNLTVTGTTESGTASSTTLVIGNGSLAGILSGTCNLGQASITASTTRGLVCSSATGITTAYKVFVQATSTLASGVTPASGGFVIVSASSTGSATIGVELSNLTGKDATPAGTLNFWAVR